MFPPNTATSTSASATASTIITAIASITPFVVIGVIHKRRHRVLITITFSTLNPKSTAAAWVYRLQRLGGGLEGEDLARQLQGSSEVSRPSLTCKHHGRATAADSAAALNSPASWGQLLLLCIDELLHGNVLLMLRERVQKSGHYSRLTLTTTPPADHSP